MIKQGHMPIWQRVVVAAIVLGGVLIFVIPLWWTLVWGTWHTAEIFSFPPKFLPGPYFFENVRDLEARLDIWGAFRNSGLITALRLAGAVFLCALAGFAFAKYRFRFKNVLFYLLLSTMAIPFQVTVIPLFIFIIKLGWVDTYRGVIIPGLVPAFGVFLMRMSAQETLPDELLEAARIDGANELEIFVRIGLPNLLPSVATLAIFLFSGTWGQLFWPLIVLRTTSKFTLPVALATIMGGGSHELPYDLLLAGSLMAVLPPLLILLFTQRFFIKSLVASSFK
jgi:ABC-type glycerol-3-phosphate transport system permease component